MRVVVDLKKCLIMLVVNIGYHVVLVELCSVMCVCVCVLCVCVR